MLIFLKVNFRQKGLIGCLVVKNTTNIFICSLRLLIKDSFIFGSLIILFLGQFP